MKNEPVEVMLLIGSSVFLLVSIWLILVLSSCGPQFDREEMSKVKRMYCADIMKNANDMESDGTILSPEELEAVRFCQ